MTRKIERVVPETLKGPIRLNQLISFIVESNGKKTQEDGVIDRIIAVGDRVLVSAIALPHHDYRMGLAFRRAFWGDGWYELLSGPFRHEDVNRLAHAVAQGRSIPGLGATAEGLILAMGVLLELHEPPAMIAKGPLDKGSLGKEECDDARAFA